MENKTFMRKVTISLTFFLLVSFHSQAVLAKDTVVQECEVSIVGIIGTDKDCVNYILLKEEPFRELKIYKAYSPISEKFIDINKVVDLQSLEIVDLGPPKRARSFALFKDKYKWYIYYNYFYDDPDFLKNFKELSFDFIEQNATAFFVVPGERVKLYGCGYFSFDTTLLYRGWYVEKLPTDGEITIGAFYEPFSEKEIMPIDRCAVKYNRDGNLYVEYHLITDPKEQSKIERDMLSLDEYEDTLSYD